MSLTPHRSTPALADRIGRYNVLFFATFGSSVVLFSWLGVNSLTGLFICGVVYGIMTGGQVALQSVCVVQATKNLEHLGVTGTLIGQQFGESIAQTLFEHWTYKLLIAPGFQALAVLIGPPISGYILGTSGSAAQQMARFPYAILLDGIVIMIGAGCAAWARFMQSKTLVAKI